MTSRSLEPLLQLSLAHRNRNGLRPQQALKVGRESILIAEPLPIVPVPVSYFFEHLAERRPTVGADPERRIGKFVARFEIKDVLMMLVSMAVMKPVCVLVIVAKKIAHASNRNVVRVSQRLNFGRRTLRACVFEDFPDAHDDHPNAGDLALHQQVSAEGI